GTTLPGTGTVIDGGTSPAIPYGTGTANLLTLPLMDWNQTYLWKIMFGNKNTWNSSFSATAQFTMAAPTQTISQHQNNGSPTANSWRFIGVPIPVGTTVPATELLSTVPLLYKLDEPSRTWIALGGGDVLEGGRGYLGWCSPTTVLNLTQGKVTAGIPPVKNGAGATTTPSYDYLNTFSYTTYAVPVGQEITDNVGANGYAGNNLFANPFYAPISWKSSTTNGPPAVGTFGQVARLNISYAMYKWDGTQYLTYNGVSFAGTAGEWIEPFQAVGIWVQAANPDLWVDTPPPLGPPAEKPARWHPAGPAVPAPPDPDSWNLRMEARSGASLDTENVFGIDPQADDAWDIRDSEEPGAGTPTWVLVYFDHRSDWTKYPRKYTHDYRQTRFHAGDQVVWNFTVDGNTNLPATLTWPTLGAVPTGDWQLTLEDPAQSAVVDLSQAASYDTLPVNGPSILTLRATRLKDSPTLAAPSGGGSSGGGGGGGSCGLLGPEGLLLAAWILARRGSRMGRRP
ncbi:MAG TPA: hypothetical protein VG457_18095, partial [Planctomycetota bacterium]|nr:hypothetical protein [Planctomycetota bacterium]